MDFVQALVKFNTQTAGRDKLCRVFQYGSKVLYWVLEELKKNPETIKKLKDLEYALSTTRKLLRFGKSVDLLHSAQKSIHISNTVRRLTITLSNINQACYLFIDHIIWLTRVGIVKTDSKKWNEISARFWMVTIILNLARDLYEICQIIPREKQSHYNNGDANHQSVERPLLTNSQLILKCVGESKPVILDTIKNGCDFFLPLASLGKVNMPVGIQGLCGLISSLIGVSVIWNPMLKMVE